MRAGVAAWALVACGRSGLDDELAAVDDGGFVVDSGLSSGSDGGRPSSGSATSRVGPPGDANSGDDSGFDDATTPPTDTGVPPFDTEPPPTDVGGRPPVDAAPRCSALNCPSGCCDADGLCEFGVAPTACGSRGVACTDCTSLAGGACVATDGIYQCVQSLPPPPLCGPGCAGCCDANGKCQPGFVDDACGPSGGRCADCRVAGGHCDVNASPRACVQTPAQCPATYDRCGAGATPAPVKARACSADELRSAAAACAGGAHSPGCTAFFEVEASQDPACAACLGPFDFDFTELTGIFACAAAFVGPACNRTTFCLGDCIATTCAGCAGPARATCGNGAIMGSCAAYVAGAPCIATAFAGPGAFCDPEIYAGFGAWLQAVGASYCGL